MTSEAKKRANMKYDAKTYEQIKIKERKEYCLNERLVSAARQAGVSKNAYMLSALERQLAADGFSRPDVRGEE